MSDKNAAPAGGEIDRDTLGRMVREAWVRWAQTQPNPKASWLVPYDELSEPDKEADRQIGEAVARWTLIHEAAKNCFAPAGGEIDGLIKDAQYEAAAWRRCEAGSGIANKLDGYASALAALQEGRDMMGNLWAREKEARHAAEARVKALDEVLSDRDTTEAIRLFDEISPRRNEFTVWAWWVVANKLRRVIAALRSDV